MVEGWKLFIKIRNFYSREEFLFNTILVLEREKNEKPHNWKGRRLTVLFSNNLMLQIENLKDSIEIEH